VQQAYAATQADASVIYVPPFFAADAILEAMVQVISGNDVRCHTL
jgi:succinyl-CoA synthetase alpha subunit